MKVPSYSTKFHEAKFWGNFANWIAFMKKFALPKQLTQRHGISQNIFWQNFAFWPICENFAPQKFHTIW